MASHLARVFHKRALCAGSGDIFEIAKVFRAGEQSRRHRVEFTMLEYYRVGFDEFALMREITDLMQCLLHAFERAPWPIHVIRFRDWFAHELGVQLDQPDAGRALQTLALQHGAQGSLNMDQAIDFLRSHVLEPRLDPECWVFVHDFPATQAALAALSADGVSARRFELFGGGFELANGYFELCDAELQRARWEKDLHTRAAQQQLSVPLDTDFLTALDRLPSCAGVAIGLDRVLMLLLNQPDIAEVLAFP
ncbi:EF-P lysine aminoacylase GenX [bacterium]|nr:EF-P lysine aminoacylase GenX [bacterium]